MSAITDQREVVRMLVARDEMNAAVHMTEVRLSPVTVAAQSVLEALEALEATARAGEPSSRALIDDVDGNAPHRFVALQYADDPEDDPICAVLDCAADDEDGSWRSHPIHAR